MQQQQQQSFRFLSVLLIIIGGLLFILFYVIPFLSSQGIGTPGYSDEHEQAYQLAQSVQAYRKRHPSPGNYAQVAIRQKYSDGPSSKWDTSDVYEGFDDIDGENSTHSEQYAHQWILSTIEIYKKLTSWSQVTGLDIVFYTQVRVCRKCQIDMRSWPNVYQKSATKPFSALWTFETNIQSSVLGSSTVVSHAVSDMPELPMSPSVNSPRT